jgi:hypothetical protein
LELNKLCKRVDESKVKLSLAVPKEKRVFKGFRVPLLKRSKHQLRTKLEKNVILLIMA